MYVCAYVRTCVRESVGARQACGRAGVGGCVCMSCVCVVHVCVLACVRGCVCVTIVVIGLILAKIKNVINDICRF